MPIVQVECEGRIATTFPAVDIDIARVHGQASDAVLKILQPVKPCDVTYWHPEFGMIELNTAAMMARGELPGKGRGLVKVAAHLHTRPSQGVH